MTRVVKTLRAGWIALGIGLAGLPAVGVAAGPQAPPAGQPPGAAPGGARQPPVVRFDPQGIGLAEAVRLTLQNSPDIQLAQAAAGQALGVAQQQIGLFDTSFFASANYNYQRQELTPTAFLSEDLKRADLRAARDEQAATVRNLTALRDQLVQMQSLSGECGTNRTSAQLAALRGLDAATAADLEVIDALCASANMVDPSQKLRSDLLAIRQRRVADTISRATSGAQAALDAENQLNSLVVNLGATPTQEYFNNGAANLSLSRLFRNGISFSPFLNGTSQGTNFVDKPFNSDCTVGPCGGKGFYPLYNFQGGFHATVPLARGLGAEAVAAPERSALVGEQAARLDAEHQAAVSALAAIRAYWNARAAQENVAIAQRSVDYQARIVQLTQQTIAAGNLPAVELARVQASEARAQSVLRDAQAALHQARVALAVAMGVAVGADDETLPRARDAFPAAPDPAAVDEPRIAALAAASLRQRKDVAAALRRAEAAEVLVRGAQLNLKPRLDVTGGSWYTGNDEAVVTNALKRWVGPSYSIGIELEKPFGNNTLRGALVEAQAGGASSQIVSADLRRQVRLSVVRTSRSLAEAIERVRQAQNAVQFYQQTIDAEIQRFQLGEVTLIDTITTEAQQADAQRALVAAQADLAQLIAELRYQTGTLVSDASAPVTPQSLVTVP